MYLSFHIQMMTLTGEDRVVQLALVTQAQTLTTQDRDRISTLRHRVLGSLVTKQSWRPPCFYTKGLLLSIIIVASESIKLW